VATQSSQATRLHQEWPRARTAELAAPGPGFPARGLADWRVLQGVSGAIEVLSKGLKRVLIKRIIRTLSKPKCLGKGCQRLSCFPHVGGEQRQRFEQNPHPSHEPTKPRL
jgi:hypothetical protein